MPKPRTRHSPDRSAGAPGRVLIYGWHSGLAALNNPRRVVHRVLATRNALERLEEDWTGPFPEPVEAREIERITTSGAVHQGLAVVCDPLPEQELDDVEAGRLFVILDQVTDPHNVGAIVRSAAAFGADALIVTERHGPVESGVMAKAASGGLEHVALVRVKNLARALDRLGAVGITRLGLDSSHAQPLETLASSGPTALVLGAEGKGMRRLTREKCDHLVRIELPGAIASLNVSNAAALALYVVTRAQRP